MSDISTGGAAKYFPLNGLLRGVRFDGNFIFGIALVALASGVAVTIQPSLFAPILFLDLWLLGYHHVISTYTRLCFDKASTRQHWPLLALLPVVLGAVILAWERGMSMWMLTTLYFHWQWFHYTRQSWGVSRVYARKGGQPTHGADQLSKAVFWLVPLWGLMHRSAQNPESFIGLDIVTLPVPMAAANALGVAAIAAFAVWIWNEMRAVRAGHASRAYVAYTSVHHAMFATAYYVIPDISHGWLVINIWHNAQYIGFVWLYNTMRFKGGVDAKAAFLSKISQPQNWWRYGLVCFGISTLVYVALQSTVADLAHVTGPALLIYMGINFHHYIVDGVIWKTRKPKMQKVLNLNSGAR